MKAFILKQILWIFKTIDCESNVWYIMYILKKIFVKSIVSYDVNSRKSKIFLPMNWIFRLFGEKLYVTWSNFHRNKNHDESFELYKDKFVLYLSTVAYVFKKEDEKKIITFLMFSKELYKENKRSLV